MKMYFKWTALHNNRSIVQGNSYYIQILYKGIVLVFPLFIEL